MKVAAYISGHSEDAALTAQNLSSRMPGGKVDA